MSEFQDFLKYKCAYVAIGEFKPGKFREAEQLYEKAVSTYAQGFQGSFLLQEPGTDKGIAVILWDSEEDMKANENEVHRDILNQINHLFAKAPITGCYQIVSEVVPKNQGAEAS